MRYAEEFIEVVKQQLQPESRVQHVVDALQQLFALVPDDVTLADIVAGWQLLSHPQSQSEEAAVTHRRHVCTQLAAIGAQVTCEPGKLLNAAKTWQVWQETCQKSTDPRHTAMAKTFARELVELQSPL